MAKDAQINIEINGDKAEKSLKDIEKEINKVTKTLGEMEDKSESLTEALKRTEIGTEEYDRLRKEIIKVNTEIKNQELAMEALDNEQMASELKSVAGGFMDMAGGIALVVGSSGPMEQVVQTIAQVEGATRIATGAMEAFASFTKVQNNIVLKATRAQQMLAAAQVKGGITAKIASVGMGILNAVMNLNPVFLIITGVSALVGVLALFFTSTNDAAEANERLNASMEAQNKLIEVQRGLRAQNQKLVDNDIKNQKKVLQGEKKILESKENLTEADKERLKAIEDEIKALDKAQLVAIKEEAVKQTEENTNKILDQFDYMKNAINATDYEDGALGGFNDIDYSEALEKTEKLRKQFVRTNAQFKARGDAEKYQKTLVLLTNNAAKLSKEFSLLDLELGEAESEEWQNLIDGTDDLVGSLQESSEIATELVTTLQDEETGEVLEDQASQLDEINKKQEEARKAREAANRALERRRKLLQKIDEIIQRESDAAKETERVRAQLIKNEEERNLKLNELKFGAERDKLIEGAIKREEAALQEKFVNGQISEEEYRKSINDLYENGADYLLEEEKELLEEKKKVYEEEKKAIKERFKFERDLAKQSAEEINSQRVLSNIEYQKQLELEQADQIKDETEREKAKLAIKKKYLQLEIDAIKTNTKEQQDVLDEQYKQDIEAAGDNEELKEKITAEYLLNKENLTRESETAIRNLIKETNEVVEKDYIEMISNIESAVDSVLNDIQTSVNSALSGSFDEINNSFEVLSNSMMDLAENIYELIQEGGQMTAQQIAQIAIQTATMAVGVIDSVMEAQAEKESEARQRRHEKEALALENSLRDREISQKEFDAKMRMLEEKQEQEELQAKRKSFKQEKGMAIVTAIMNTANAVISGLAAPFPLNLIMPAIAGALGAAQIAIISSQKFKAARGGVVPGNGPSNIDSVDAQLAPGETVINAESSRMFAPELDAMNRAGGGVSLMPEPVQASSNVIGTKRAFEENKDNDKPEIRAFVVEEDISNSQKKQRRFERRAEFG